MKKENVKGFKDYIGEEARKRSEIRKIIERTFEGYGFEPAETPIVEYEEFVKGPESQADDEAVSDIFKLKDKGKRELALRYEFTFQLKRIMKDKKLPWKRYQIGPVFRDEPVSENRMRQFTQCDIDVIGSTIKDEAEVLSVTNEIMKKIGINPVILINNRALLNEILENNGVKEERRERVMREIDKYDKMPEKELRKNLRALGAENVLDSLKKGEKYFNQFESYKDIINLMEYCKLYGLRVQFSPTIIRGLSYYNGSVFEVKQKGIKETIAGGGSYMFNGVQCTGISFGLERVSLLSNIKVEKERYLVISLGKDKKAVKLAQKLRAKGNETGMYYGRPSKALEYANAYGFKKVIFVGEREVKAKKFKVKDMDSGKNKLLKINS